MTAAAPFTCPRCDAQSSNPGDIREGYCGRCHDWTRDQLSLLDLPPEGEARDPRPGTGANADRLAARPMPGFAKNRLIGGNA